MCHSASTPPSSTARSRRASSWRRRCRRRRTAAPAAAGGRHGRCRRGRGTRRADPLRDPPGGAAHVAARRRRHGARGASSRTDRELSRGIARPGPSSSAGSAWPRSSCSATPDGDCRDHRLQRPLLRLDGAGGRGRGQRPGAVGAGGARPRHRRRRRAGGHGPPGRPLPVAQPGSRRRLRTGARRALLGAIGAAPFAAHSMWNVRILCPRLRYLAPEGLRRLRSRVAEH